MGLLAGVGRVERQSRARASSVRGWGAPAGALKPLAINQTASTSSFTARGTLESTRGADDASVRSRASSTPPARYSTAPTKPHADSHRGTRRAWYSSEYRIRAPTGNTAVSRTTAAPHSRTETRTSPMAPKVVASGAGAATYCSLSTTRDIRLIAPRAYSIASTVREATYPSARAWLRRRSTGYAATDTPTTATPMTRTRRAPSSTWVLCADTSASRSPALSTGSVTATLSPPAAVATRNSTPTTLAVRRPVASVDAGAVIRLSAGSARSRTCATGAPVSYTHLRAHET